MKLTPYTYTVLRYANDLALGESLNVGVLLHAPDARFVALRVEDHYQRLSAAFPAFDGRAYRDTVQDLRRAVAKLCEEWPASLLPDAGACANAHMVGRLICPDQDLTFSFGELQAGVAEDMDDALDRLYARFVEGQQPSADPGRRDDREVWARCREAIERRRPDLVPHLRPKTFRTDDGDYERTFDNAYQNGKWQVLEPVSLDYKRPETIRERAEQCLGVSQALRDHPELGRLYFLVGPPTARTHDRAYQRAKALLERVHGHDKVVEEDKADQLALDLEPASSEA